MRGVFLSYRRSDTAGHVGRINDRLAAQFGDERVFMDVGDIAPGEDFTIALERELEKADTVLVVIGDDWLTVAITANGDSTIPPIITAWRSSADSRSASA
jgi:hypothetical protein